MASAGSAEVVGMLQAMLDRSSLLRLVLIAMGYGIVFILMRAAVRVVLSAFIGNIFVAVGIGALIAAFVCFPTLLAGTMRALKSRKTVAR